MIIDCRKKNRKKNESKIFQFEGLVTQIVQHSNQQKRQVQREEPVGGRVAI
jgi:hypothetical protein